MLVAFRGGTLFTLISQLDLSCNIRPKVVLSVFDLMRCDVKVIPGFKVPSRQSDVFL
jgi:hypothetical protein